MAGRHRRPSTRTGAAGSPAKAEAAEPPPGV